jgi:hypothetical protein
LDSDGAIWFRPEVRKNRTSVARATSPPVYQVSAIRRKYRDLKVNAIEATTFNAPGILSQRIGRGYFRLPALLIINLLVRLT